MSLPQPPDRKLTFFTQHQRVIEWLESIERPEGLQFLDMDQNAILVVMKTLDRRSRSNLEKTCKLLLSVSRGDRPFLQSLSLHFTTTWNHDQFAEITAQFSDDHSFHAVFMCKNKTKNFISGGWSTERNRNITTGTFPLEKLRLNGTFVEKTSTYIEYWLKNFKFDVLKIKVENLIPGREHETQQMNYIGKIPILKLKKLEFHGANNIRFIHRFLDQLIPNIIDPEDAQRKTVDVELIDVAKLDQIFNHRVMTTGNVNLVFNRASTHFTRKSLNLINTPTMIIVARQVPSEAVNAFLKRWSRGEITEDFEYMHITETTQWPAQEIEIKDVIKGLRHQSVELTTDLDLRILRDFKETQKIPQIYQIIGPRIAFCIQYKSQFIFEVPKESDLEKIIVNPPITRKAFDEYERQRNRIYMELFRRKLIRLYN